MRTSPNRVDNGSLSAVQYFDPGEYMIIALRRAAVHRQNIIVEVKDQGSLILLGARAQYLIEVTSEQAFFTTPISQVDITLLQADDHRIPDEGTSGRQLEELMWRSTYYASAGRLIKGCYRDDVIKLEYWPNLTRLPHGPNAMRIAALLCKHSTSMSLTSRLLKVDLAEVSQFYSAARSAGLARAVNRTTQEPKLEPYKLPSRLTELFKKVVRL